MELSEIIEILDAYSNEYLHERNMIKSKAFENIAKDLYKEFQAKKKAIAEKAFIAGGDLSDEEWWLGEYATTENLKEHERLKYKDFEEWYKQEIEKE
jgi:hypothetical protein